MQLPVPKVRTVKGVLYIKVLLWKKLSDEMKNARTLSAFKYRLNIDKPSPKKLYFFGDRKEKIRSYMPGYVISIVVLMSICI